jgi:hypothetical protein
MEKFDCQLIWSILEGKNVRLPGLGEMLTFKSSTKRLDREKEEKGLF